MFVGEDLDESRLLQHDLFRGDEHRALESIRREASSPYNRLHSIEEDARFVKSIHKVYSQFPLIREFLFVVNTGLIIEYIP